MKPERVPIRIVRGTPGESPRTETYEVPYREGMSVLDAVVWVRTHVDASIAFRYSCINANACKECMVEVDGKTQYACTARLGTAGVTVAPLGNKDWVRDLVTDIVPPKESLASVLAERERR
jgi:succinate dehydrogenase/fumarate reductase-like Fe-S protein